MIPIAKPYISSLEKKYVNAAVESGWVSSQGEYIIRFEEKLKEYLGASFVTSTSNGTSALHLALLALDIKAGDEVILPASSFIATLNAILYVGAIPVFVDIELDSWGINSKKIEEKITDKTKAILLVHLYGYAADVYAVKGIADKYGLYLIEDNAESLGATAQGKKLGTIGHIGTYSFFGNKIITTGEGGAISTNDAEIMKKINICKNHGRAKNGGYQHTMIGFNYRMTNLQAAIGVAQLEQIDMFLEKRQEIEKTYDSYLGNSIKRQKDVVNTDHVNWMYSGILSKDIDIEQLKSYLFSVDIDSRRLFAPMNTMSYLSKEMQKESYPNAVLLYTHGISLPTYVGLSAEEIEYITSHIKIYLEQYV
ncbi:DegT/DnrJ/EryC1/StrS aminotransferase family protein [Patescibacteria group bacterium]|nr:DegT/DnrJ/EryC1/StrS aminotransferase family protein [Patescibacteria group bacterium]MBU1722124.1 DegT/DnrJ/EryC1/StrS aminotransferase family protein [Patescibacteria group bacterium]MBU1901173.1 DegT/DnrJ/EryC1/StrS aminotransferase family protein [Patescibacteria group bacterium]